MTTPEQPSPEEEARLRRMLARARETEPMPPEVVARMEATLDELDSERTTDPGPTVVRFHRRRRTVAGILAAAAIVVVAGVGVGQVFSGDGSGQTAADSAQDERSVESEEDQGEPEAVTGAQSAAADAASGDVTAELFRETELEVRMVDTEAPVIRKRRVHDDALGVRNGLSAEVTEYWNRPESLLLSPTGFECQPADWGDGVLVGVQYARTPAVLALRAPAKQHQVAEVLQCGTGEQLRSVTLSAP